MHFPFPYSKDRRYLSGMDWVIGATDCPLKRLTGAGNFFNVHLDLAGPIDGDGLRTLLNSFVREFPLLFGRVGRDWKNLVPYWKAPREAPRSGGPGGLIDFAVRRADTAEGFDSLLNECLNRPFRSNSEHLAIRLIHLRGGPAGDRCCLVLSFDHKVFDGRGAEAFIELLRRYIDGERGICEGLNRSAPTGLINWAEKFLAGQVLNRKFISLSKGQPRTFEEPRLMNGAPRKKMMFRHFTLDKASTVRVFNSAQAEAGFLMETPYLLACATEAVHGLFEGRAESHGESYVVPVTFDVRGPEGARREVFFNHASFFFFQLMVGEADKRGALIRRIKEQMYEQVQSAFPSKFLQAAMLTRIAPVRVIDRIQRKFYGKGLLTFSFSYLGRTSVSEGRFMGAEIENLYHFPRVPVPPGVGVFMNLYRGRLNISLIWLQDMISEAEADGLIDRLRRRLQFG